MNITPSTVTMHPPETTASSCCLVILLSAMIKVSFKALSTLITHCWLHNESQGGSWLRTPSFIITSLERIKLNLSQWSLEECVPGLLRGVTEVAAGLSWLISAEKPAADPFWMAMFSTWWSHELPETSFAPLSCLSPHALTSLWCAFGPTLKVGSFERHSTSNQILTHKYSVRKQYYTGR